MTAPRLVVLAVATALALSGCSAVAEPQITDAPPTTGGVPEQHRTPEPSPSASAPPAPTPSVIPGTNLRAGKTPGTVLGPNGDALRYVPPVADWEPTCRPATEAEREAMNRVERAIGNTPTTARGPAMAVDLPEQGWSVVAYWTRRDNGDVDDRQLVRGANGVASGIGWAWAGTHTYGGAAFADGPEALGVARECVGAQA